METPETSYVVTFTATGGVPAPKKQRVAEGGAATAPAAMNKTGYTFAYWYAEDSGSPWNFDTGIITGDMTLYAHWEPIAYTVVYAKNADDAAGFMADSSHAYDKAENLSANVFTRPGHAFIGWAASPAEPAAYWDGQSVNNLSAEQGAAITLYAKWAAGSGYTVTFNLNGGAGTDTIGYAVDTPAITLPAPVRTGYAFEGWYTDSALSGEAVGEIPQGSAGNREFWAKWTAVSYAITFDLNGGDPLTNPPASYTVESPAISLPAPARTGYLFGGWYAAGQPVTEIPPGSIGNIDYWAKWTAVSYTIVFDLNGGGTVANPPASYTVESPAITLPAPVRTGYAFGGWYTDSALTGEAVREIPQGSAGNREFWAKWTAVSYAITFDLNGGDPLTNPPASYTVESPAISLPAPARPGYLFGGWYAAGQPVTEIPPGSTGSRDYWAKWTAKSLERMEIASPPAKTAYLLGEPLYLNGLTIKKVYNDGSSTVTSGGYEARGDTFTAGNVTLTLAAAEDAAKTLSLPIQVSPELMDTGLPVVYIETQNSQPIVSKEVYVKMNFRIVSDNPDHCVEKTGFNDNIRGRGNSTWSYPKKPYRIKFDSKTALFGLTRAKSWVLLANYKDATLLTNTVAFELGRRFGLPYTHHYFHVEVVLNGVYQGSYVLTEQVQVGEGRVDIDEDEGFLAELDVYYDEEPKFKTTNLQLPVMIKSPEDLPDSSGYDFVRDSLNALDAALSSPDFPNNDYADLIDMDTFVDFIMINEIVKNGELGHPKSTYLYKDAGPEARISMGPLWDFDWAFGIGGGTSVNVATAESRYMGGWFFGRFFNDPAFVSAYRQRWNEKYPDIASMGAFIETKYRELRLSQSLNSRRWYALDYRQEIDRMKIWWDRRAAYLNGEISTE